MSNGPDIRSINGYRGEERENVEIQEGRLSAACARRRTGYRRLWQQFIEQQPERYDRRRLGHHQRELAGGKRSVRDDPTEGTIGS
jgi:hypothetical protein